MKTTVTLNAGPIVCMDFDGVIHSYTSGWQGVDRIPDPPVANAKMAIRSYLDAGLQVAVLSSRSSSLEGRAAMYRWFQRNLPELADMVAFVEHKPPAVITIDDRAYCFKGAFPSPDEIRNFQTWVGGPAVG